MSEMREIQSRYGFGWVGWCVFHPFHDLQPSCQFTREIGDTTPLSTLSSSTSVFPLSETHTPDALTYPIRHSQRPCDGTFC